MGRKTDTILTQTARVSCILNPGAARNKWQRRRSLRNFLRKTLPGEIHDSLGNREATVRLATRVSQESDVLVAAGGDGTIADVLQGVIDSGKKDALLFGIIPLGSGNAFRKSLGIPKKIGRAIRVLHKGKPREIDLMDAGGRVSAFASIGATALVTREKLQHETQGLLGHLAAGKIMLRIPKEEREVVLLDGIGPGGKPFDRKEIRIRFYDCVVAKSNYFGYSWRIAPKAKVDDGYLDITFFETNAWTYVLFFPLIYFGLFQRTQKHFKAKKVIFRGSELAVQYNGEFFWAKDEVEFRVLPRAIRVICPERRKRFRLIRR